MTYVAWAVLYEGESDAAYYNVLIPRVMEAIAAAGSRLPVIPSTPAIRLARGTVQAVAEEGCRSSDAFHLLFIHADTGGRGVASGLAGRSSAFADAMQERCGWPQERCVVIAPRHETEAWVLADPMAVTSTLGYTGLPNTLGLPASAAEAERLVDPKLTLQAAIQNARGRRRNVDLAQVLPAIAQRQRLDELRRADSFRAFEDSLQTAMRLIHAA